MFLLKSHGLTYRLTSEYTFTLTTGRTEAQGIALEIDKFDKVYLEAVAMCEIDKQDLRKLGITSGSNVIVETPYGKIIVRAIASPRSHPGIIFMPWGPWANVIVSPDTDGSGMPGLKTLPARVKPTSRPISSLISLLREVSPKKPVRMNGMSSSSTSSPVEYEVSNVICPICGSACDDLKVTVRGSKIVDLSRAHGCAIARAKFLNLKRIAKPLVRKNGEFIETDLDEAIDVATDILVNAKYPILYGWSSTVNEAMDLGIELTELVGGVVDNTATTCHGPSLLAMHQTGLVFFSLGQIKNRADVVVYWGCNPTYAHLRHPVRYSGLSTGRYIKGFSEGEKGRKIIVIDVISTPTDKLADLFIRVEPGMDYELLTALRMLVNDYDMDTPVAGVDNDVIIEMAEMMMSAKFGVIFFGLGLTMTPARNRNVEEAIRLTQDLNKLGKWVILPMRGHFNVTGTNHVMAWITGFPYAVDLSKGYPWYDPGITSVSDILLRKEADAAFIIASDPVSHFPKKAVEHLTSIPMIVVDPRWTPTAAVADVYIPTAFVGIEQEGTIHRMDGVPLYLRRIVDPPPGVPTDEKVLAMLIEKVKARKMVGQ